MSDFAATYAISRQRFDDALTGLNQPQLNWRLNAEAMTIGEMALHLAGVEVSFASQLKGTTLGPELVRLRNASVDGLMNSNPFPYSPEEITPERVAWALAAGRSHATDLLADLEPYRDVQIKSALGPMIDGTGACARLAFHPAYHTGQIFLIRTSPGFPA